MHQEMDGAKACGGSVVPIQLVHGGRLECTVTAARWEPHCAIGQPAIRFIRFIRFSSPGGLSLQPSSNETDA
jgi:hypothetical protein